MKKIKAKHIVIFLLLGFIISCENPFFPDKIEKSGSKVSTGKTARELADDFINDYADALELEVESVTTNDEAKVNSALDAFNKLSDAVKALLEDEKSLLDDLKAKIEELKAAATAQQLADTFKAGNANALELTVGTVTPLDEAIVDAALESYELLSNDAKALLTEEKELLDILKEAIGELLVRITITNSTEWREAVTTINSGGSGTSISQKYYTLTIDGDFETSSTNGNTFSPSYITLILNGRGTISLSSNGGNLIYIGNNQTLVIDSENLTLKGRSGNAGSVLNANYGSQLELRSGTIKGNDASSSGGGVLVSNGTFTMNGGSISSNNASSGVGGGVLVEASGTFTMNSGSISSNTSTYYGGGVSLFSGTFTMNGGSISSNIANVSGGGVYVTGGTFTMTGGSISGNIASSQGGGVYVTGGTFTMTGGSISSNTSIYYGGGVSVSGTSSTFTMSDGSISDNTTYYYSGGGVYVGSSSTFTKANTGGIISGNTANGQQVLWESSPVRYVNNPLGETDELSTKDPDSGWLSE